MHGTEIRFINGEEGAQHLAGLSKITTFNRFKYSTTQKLWPGKVLAVYRIDEEELNPIILAKVKVQEVGMGPKGMFAEVLDCSRNTTMTVDHIPRFLCGYEIITHFPQKVHMERTIREVTNEHGERKYTMSTAAGWVIRQMYAPETGAEQDSLCNWGELADLFTSGSAFTSAMEDYRRRVRT
jgi:hypothetical protein